MVNGCKLQKADLRLIRFFIVNFGVPLFTQTPL